MTTHGGSRKNWNTNNLSKRTWRTLMSITTLILGESGTGKTASLRNLNPADTLLVQVVKKPLPFRSSGWGYFDKEKNPAGNIFVTDRWDQIIAISRKTKRQVIVIDDFQYVLANEFMRRTDEKGYDKFTEIGRHTWEVLQALNTLPDGVRVYIPWHTDISESGRAKAKTIGKMLDEKITIEGLFTIVLRTAVIDGQYFFCTKNSGADTVKTPMGLFADDRIDNDLASVDAAICDYYGITTNEEA